MSIPKTWITKVFESQDLLKAITYTIRQKAKASNELGFGNLSEDLYSYADQIDEEVKVIIANITDNILAEFKNSQQQIGETFKVLLDKK